MAKSLGKELEGAKVIKHDDQSGLTFAWFGGQSMGIHGYNSIGQEVCYWTMGGCKTDNATIDEVHTSIQSHVADEYFPY